MSASLADQIELHSGDYVERYDAKSPNRVINMIPLMNIGDGERVADYACGNGMLLEALGTRSGVYHGVDFSPDFIKSAERRAEAAEVSNYEFYCEDIIEFCRTRQNSYDVATTLDFSEHIEDQMFIDIYRAIYSSMVEGGRMYLHTPNLDFIVERFKDVGIMKQFPEHIGVRTGDHYVELLAHAGFERSKVTVKTIPHYNILRILHPFRKLPVIGKLFAARLWIEAVK